jgi:hypothetical protein
MIRDNLSHKKMNENVSHSDALFALRKVLGPLFVPAVVKCVAIGTI